MNWRKWKLGLLVAFIIGFFTACAAAAVLDVRINLKFFLFFVGLIGKDVILYLTNHKVDDIQFETEQIKRTDMKNLLALLFTIPALLAFSGCGTLKDPNQLAAALADARDVGEVGTQVALAEKPEYRAQLEQTRDALKIVEALPQAKATVDDLVNALKPIKQLQSPRVQLYVALGKPILRRIIAATGSAQEVDVSQFSAVPQFAKALREGIDAGLGTAPGAPGVSARPAF